MTSLRQHLQSFVQHEGGFRSLVAAALLVFVALTFVEALGSPGAVIRSRVSARPIQPANSAVSDVRPDEPPANRVDLGPVYEAHERGLADRNKLVASMSQLVEDLKAKLNVDVSTASKVQDSILGEVLRTESSARKAWQAVTEALNAGRIAMSAFDEVSRRVQRVNTETTKAAADGIRADLELRSNELTKALALLANAKGDVEHLQVLVDAHHLEKRLQN